MKSLVIISVSALLLMSACSQKKDEALKKANNERDSLALIITQRDASLSEFLVVTDEIERNLDSIAIREGALTMSMLKKVELKPSMKDRINADIAAINDLMKENRTKISDLSSRLKRSNYKVEEYEQMIQQLNARVSDKDQSLMTLNDRLASLNMQVTNLQTSVDVLKAENLAQSQTIDEQTTALHTAYYVVGESKDLREKKIINKTGGLLGIGRTSQIDPNIDNSNFTRIDYTKVNDIEIAGNGVKIITSHPADSYNIDKDHDKFTNLIITDPDKFWSASKYLVVVKN